MTPNVRQVAEGAYFVPSYSVSTLERRYSPVSTNGSPATDEEEEVDTDEYGFPVDDPELPDVRLETLPRRA